MEKKLKLVYENGKTVEISALAEVGKRVSAEKVKTSLNMKAFCLLNQEQKEVGGFCELPQLLQCFCSPSLCSKFFTKAKMLFNRLSLFSQQTILFPRSP